MSARGTDTSFRKQRTPLRAAREVALVWGIDSWKVDHPHHNSPGMAPPAARSAMQPPTCHPYQMSAFTTIPDSGIYHFSWSTSSVTHLALACPSNALDTVTILSHPGFTSQGAVLTVYGWASHNHCPRLHHLQEPVSKGALRRAKRCGMTPVLNRLRLAVCGCQQGGLEKGYRRSDDGNEMISSQCSTPI